MCILDQIAFDQFGPNTIFVDYWAWASLCKINFQNRSDRSVVLVENVKTLKKINANAGVNWALGIV